MSEFLIISNLVHSFSSVLAIDHLSITIHKGDIFGIIGPNGAGKTTLFNLLSGIIKVASGTIIYQGEKIENLNIQQIARSGIARTFQNIRLFKQLTVLNNIMISSHIHYHYSIFDFLLYRSKKQDEAALDDALKWLKLFDCDHLADQIAGTLSYGNQRRIEIIRTLALRPKLLLLDEPAAGMNTAETLELKEFLKKIHYEHGITMLIIEHHMPFIMNFCQRIAVMNFGTVIAEGSPDEIKNNPVVIESYLGNQ